MTPQEINEAVARKLGVFNPTFTFDYCHSIEAAWEVAEVMGSAFNICRDFDTPNWLVRCTDGALRIGIQEPDFEIIEAATAPMAICLAFLKLNEKRD